MKLFKKILLVFIFILLLTNIWVVFTNKGYLYKALANTYLIGRSGPNATEYKIFSNREVKAGTYVKWPLAKQYNSKKIAGKYLHDIENMETLAFAVVQNDSLIHEQYWAGISDSSNTNSFSMAKTIISILVGIAIDDGYIRNVDEPISTYLPEFKNSKYNITIKHLLTMSSGINFNEDYVSPFAYPAESYYGSDLRTLTYTYKSTNEPGKVFDYLSGNTQLLGFVLEKAVGKSVSEYASQKLWKPLGAKYSAYWSLDHENGSEKAYCCFNSNATDFARIGNLYLNKGMYNNIRIVDSHYVKNSFKPADLIEQSGKKNNSYGYSWWIIPNYKGQYIYYARGILGQYIICLPQQKMVVVRLGEKRESKRIDDHPADVFYYIDAAINMYGK